MGQHSSLYGSRWRKAREGYLRKHPLCSMCEAEGRVEAATVVDHIQPHKGDMSLFWDSANWSPMCKWHHDSYKQKIEKRRVEDFGCDEDGVPNDPNHHWR